MWRRWPSQIEFDLLNLPAPVDIADWLQGTRDEHGRLKLSSRRLLVILEKLPDESQFKTWAFREGDWPPALKIAAATHNQVARHTSSFLSSKGVEGDDVLYYPFESPVEVRERIAESEDDDDVAQDLISSLFGE